MAKHIAFHQYDDCDITIVPDAPHVNGCLQCKLNHEDGHDDCLCLCMLEGTRYHVSKIVRYNGWQTFCRMLKRLVLKHY